MSRTIVIPDANFTANRLDVVELGDIIPCTGLEISQSTIAFTAINATQELTLTKTPADTTQRVYWTSSNENVATVADGVVTCVGVGSCTITATCGRQTVTCSVSSTLTLTASDLGYTNGLSLYLRDGYDYVSNQTGEKIRSYYTTTQTGYRMGASSSVFDGKYPILIPKNANNIKITAHKNWNRDAWRYALTNSQERSSMALSDNNECAKVYEIETAGASTVSGDTRYWNISLENVDSHVDSFVFQVASASYAADAISTDITVLFTGT